MSIEPGAFNVNDAAAYLGIGRTTWHEIRAQRFVPKVILPGGGVRYRKAVLDALLKELEVRTPQERIARNDRRRSGQRVATKEKAR